MSMMEILSQPLLEALAPKRSVVAETCQQDVNRSNWAVETKSKKYVLPFIYSNHILILVAS